VKRAALLLTALVGAFAFALSRGSHVPASPPKAPSEARPAPAPRPQPPAELTRDPFEYGGSTVRTEQPGAAVVPSAPVEAAPSRPPAAVRLVGFVQQAGRLRAALVIEGETVLLAAGEAASGYALLAADEQSGARLRAPDGSEIVLEVPE